MPKEGLVYPVGQIKPDVGQMAYEKIKRFIFINMVKKQGQRPKHVPQRTCVVCKQKTDKRHLTRIVNTPENQVVVDRSGKQNGRGAYVCDQLDCWQKLTSKPSILNQALKTTVSPESLADIAAHTPKTAVANND